MVKVLNYEETRALVLEVIEEAPLKGDTLAACQYVTDEYSVDSGEAEKIGEPICVVGHLFVNKLGIDPAVLLDVNGSGINYFYLDVKYDNETTAALRTVRETVSFTRKALDYLDTVQYSQDEDKTWAVADSIGVDYVQYGNGSLDDDEEAV